MKIALLTKYGALAASTRQRFHQYGPLLEANGFELIPQPLLDDVYLTRLYEGSRRDNCHVSLRYFDRLMWLLSSPDADLIWLHCELFPFLPGLMERLVSLPGKPIVFDYDDAIFHNYDQHKSGVVRQVLGQKLQSTISVAKLVIAGNAYLSNYARPFCQHVEIVPTVVDTSKYRAGSYREAASRQPRVGWIGTPSTWSEYLVDLMPALLPTIEEANGRLAVMGAVRNTTPQDRLDLEDWSEEAEVPFLQSLDIGIMPLTDTPWARGKCGYKLIQYMACGIPVIASPVGVNADIVEHGVNGFLASDDTEWSDALRTLLHDPDLRAQMGKEGRRKVEREYSLQVWGPRIAQMLRDVASQNRRG